MALRESRILDPKLECMTPAAREAFLSERLRATVAHARTRAPRVRRTLDAAGVTDVGGLEDLARIPITRKDALAAMQAEEPPFGGLLAVDPGRLARAFMSPGPIFDPQGDAEDFWGFAPAVAAAGFRAGELAINSASYHLTPLGFMLEAGARKLGCAVIPAGTAPTEQQVRAASHLRATGFLGLPSFLRTLLARGRELGTPLAIEAAFVVAEMLPPSLREELERDFGVRVLQGYGTADLGCLAYECAEKSGWHLRADAIVEVLDLETGRPAAPGQPGEVVATIFDEAYPLLRLAVGDLSAVDDGACPCGRTAPRLAGLLGRVGDAVKVKGLFVRGSQIDEVVKRFPEVKRWQAVVTRDAHHDRLRFVVEVDEPARHEGLAARLADALREGLTVRGDVELAREGTLPAGAKKVDDRREWK